ncbi:chemotaxis protein CheC [Methanoplanus endosymbiosus]|uniref:Chemotaxis protein CheC n=1 Tax=Methanoplanus endosymbiosus TaxID=33865 RepID=A0A9E7PNV4_9EURY|nr:chemotaxis protein CheC [Methanoplanus endosymbiosus]UUX93668.1 chemotaxis protein CheC [Methanoplanus endosymbiosus]
MPEKYSENDIDAVREILNIGIGRAAGMLNKITKSHITLTVPDVEIISPKEFSERKNAENKDNLATVKLEFRGEFSGTTAVLFPPDSAANLVMAITGEEAGTAELDSIRIETLKEIGNIIINGVMGSVGNIINSPLNYEIPAYNEESINSLIAHSKIMEEDGIIIAMTKFSVADLNVKGTIVMVLETGSMDILLEKINSI